MHPNITAVKLISQLYVLKVIVQYTQRFLFEKHSSLTVEISGEIGRKLEKFHHLWSVLLYKHIFCMKNTLSWPRRLLVNFTESWRNFTIFGVFHTKHSVCTVSVNITCLYVYCLDHSLIKWIRWNELLIPLLFDIIWRMMSLTLHCKPAIYNL